jgi:hypothetical protein
LHPAVNRPLPAALAHRYIVWIAYGIDPDISRAWTIDQGRFAVPSAGKL